jgi:hypothetical protein
MSGATTRAAESILGGRLSQDRLMNALTMNVNLGQGMTIMQARRMMQSNNAGMMGAFADAFGSL